MTEIGRMDTRHHFELEIIVGESRMPTCGIWEMSKEKQGTIRRFFEKQQAIKSNRVFSTMHTSTMDVILQHKRGLQAADEAARRHFGPFGAGSDE